MTIVAESLAKSGHDILQFPNWMACDQAKNLVQVDDLIAQANGSAPAVVEYLGKVDGHWVAVPATTGSQPKGPCGRIGAQPGKRMKLLADLGNMHLIDDASGRVL